MCDSSHITYIYTSVHHCSTTLQSLCIHTHSISTNLGVIIMWVLDQIKCVCVIYLSSYTLLQYYPDNLWSCEFFGISYVLHALTCTHSTVQNTKQSKITKMEHKCGHCACNTSHFSTLFSAVNRLTEHIIRHWSSSSSLEIANQVVQRCKLP